MRSANTNAPTVLHASVDDDVERATRASGSVGHGGLIATSDVEAPPLASLSALARIKTYTTVADEHSGELLRVPAIASTSLFADGYRIISYRFLFCFAKC